MKVHPGGYLVKLVRDRVAQALGGDGTVTYRPMPRDEHVRQLRRKLVEEALEYALDPSADELADVLAVARALALVDLGVPWSAIRDAELERHGERGGFEQGVGMYVLHPYDDPDRERERCIARGTHSTDRSDPCRECGGQR